MDDLYGKVVFDEWAVVAMFDRKGRILHYTGPRKEDLLKTFSTDVREFAAALVSGQQSIGDFDFSRHGSGTHFDAYVVVGEGCYLICNNTSQSMAGITKDTRWLNAQVPFAELSDKFRSDPLIFPM
jgi:hypothetical protein